MSSPTSGPGKGWEKIGPFAKGFAPYLQSELNRVIEADVKKCSAEQKRDAPRRTGKMANETIPVSSGPNSYSAVSKMFYSPFVNFGTYKMMARPFFTDAVKKYTPMIVTDVDAAFTRSIKHFFP